MIFYRNSFLKLVPSLVIEIPGRIFSGSRITPTTSMIPFEIVDKNEPFFSHRNYSGLYFSRPPRKYQLLRRFAWLLDFSSTQQCCSLIWGIAKQASSFEDRIAFLRLVETRTQIQLQDFKSAWGIFFSNRYKAKVSSINQEVNRLLTISTLNEFDFDIPYRIEKEYGHLNFLIEVSILFTESGFFNIKKEKEFAIWLGKKFGIDISNSFETSAKRIKKGTKDDFYCSKLIQKIIKGRDENYGIPSATK